MSSNEWCRTLGIEPPDLGAAKDQREANTYSCLIVALLERGEPGRAPVSRPFKGPRRSVAFPAAFAVEE